MKVALIGYGKMGKAIAEVIAENPEDEVILTVDLSEKDETLVEKLKVADVAIEFTEPGSAYENVKACFEAGVPVVIGTTGWLDKLEELKEVAEKEGKGLFWASNFSVGVNLFFELSRTLGKLMKQRAEYDVSIHEIHHKEKKDAPSGTAITLANDLIDLLQYKDTWVSDAPDAETELPVLSYREDNVAGTHLINFESEVDSIEIKHTAHNRRGFAEGAVQAARFMVGRKGYFSMKDLLHL